MSIEPFGTLPGGEAVSRYTLENNAGMWVSAINYGGIITNVFVPDRNGKHADVVLGHEALESYLLNPGSYGALIGRNANRIREAKLLISGKLHDLPDTGKGSNSHGGPRGLSRRYYHAELKTVDGMPSLTMTLTVPDMDDGFPGALSVTAAYTLTDDNALVLRYRASSSKDTIINLTNHSYFNLSGHAGGPVYDQLLWLNSDFYAANAADDLASGEILSVAGTPMDFREAKPIGRDIAAESGDKTSAGYNHHYFINGAGYRKFATLSDPESGRVMNAFTDAQGVQLFTANHLPTPCVEKDRAQYVKHQGVALETQFCPNSSWTPWLRSPIHRAGEEFRSTTAYQFGIMRG